jgi:arginyl-tRNA--protein-N-Asp/Glu arginylyltransferase
MNIKIDIFNEITWPQFKQLKEVQNLSERDKIRHYNFYLDQLNTTRFQNWYSTQPKGSRKEIQITGVLLQEDLFDLLQEDGSQIYITSEVTI